MDLTHKSHASRKPQRNFRTHIRRQQEGALERLAELCERCAPDAPRKCTTAADRCAAALDALAAARKFPARLFFSKLAKTNSQVLLFSSSEGRALTTPARDSWGEKGPNASQGVKRWSDTRVFAGAADGAVRADAEREAAAAPTGVSLSLSSVGCSLRRVEQRLEENPRWICCAKRGRCDLAPPFKRPPNRPARKARVGLGTLSLSLALETRRQS